MNPIYQELIERIRGEVSDIEFVAKRAIQSWQKMQEELEDRDVYLDSVALNLHSFYSGIERLFELIARHVDQSIPSGETWHLDLLQQMAKDLSDIRPAVIDDKTAITLEEFRRFRHLVRNIYARN